MATFNAAITQSADDARETGSGTVSITNAYVWSQSTNDYIGLRFQSVTIPQGSTINSAYLTVYLGNDADDPDLLIWCQDADDTAAFTTTNDDISGRTKTTASVAWQDTNLGYSQQVQTPDLKTIVQEVIDRPGWTSGNSIAFILLGQTAAYDFVMAAWDSSDPEAELDIDYTAPGAAAAKPKTARVRLTSKVGGALVS